ncbi:MAG: 5'/3'-nucleotidase SurE [Alphaproteobacteria bacterium]
MTEKIRLPRILVTNDDGADAPGLALLAEIASGLAEEVWVVAPERDCSGTSMMMALRDSIRVAARGERRYIVRGTPGDCVVIALHHLMKDKPPQLLLSGINAGSNLGDEANLSGTLGAALAGLMLGIPSIAISQECVRDQPVKWETARTHLPGLLQILLGQGWRRDTCLSVNIPDAPPEQIREIAWTRQAQKTIAGMRVDARSDLRGDAYFWMALDRKPAEPDSLSDVAALRRKRISVSCMGLDRSIDPGRRIMPLDPEADEYAGT